MSENWKPGVTVSMREMRKIGDPFIYGHAREADFEDNLITMDTDDGLWEGSSQEFEKIWEVTP